MADDTKSPSSEKPASPFHPTSHPAAQAGGVSGVPTDWGLEFTGTLALVALVGPALNARPALVGAVAAGVVALLAHGLPYRLGLFVAAIAGIVAATLADSWSSPRAPQPETSP